MNMTLDTLDNMTPKSFRNAQIGFGRMYDIKNQAEWERARWMACVIINPHLKRSIDPKKITTFPWEKKTKKKTKVDIDKLIKESQYQDKLIEAKKKRNE